MTAPTGNPRGRPKGSINKASRQIRDRAAVAGMLPHEFLLAVSRGEAVGDYTPTFENRLEAAKAAAPFFAPRMAAVDMTAAITTTIYDVTAEPMSEADWEAANVSEH